MTTYFYEKKLKSGPYLAVPIYLLEDAKYKRLSSEAKLLYSSMLRRVDLSRRNGWLDDLGRVYQFYTIQEAMSFLGCCKQKVVNTFRELEQVDLLERQNQGRGKPAKVLLKTPKASCNSSKPGSEYQDIVDRFSEL